MRASHLLGAMAAAAALCAPIPASAQDLTPVSVSVTDIVHVRFRASDRLDQSEREELRRRCEAAMGARIASQSDFQSAAANDGWHIDLSLRDFWINPRAVDGGNARTLMSVRMIALVRAYADGPVLARIDERRTAHWDPLFYLTRDHFWSRGEAACAEMAQIAIDEVRDLQAAPFETAAALPAADEVAD